MAQAQGFLSHHITDSLVHLKGKLLSKPSRLNQHILLADHFYNTFAKKLPTNSVINGRPAFLSICW